MMYRTNARPAALAVDHALRIVAPAVKVVEESDEQLASCVSDVEPAGELEAVRWKYFSVLFVVTVTLVVLILIFAKPLF